MDYEQKYKEALGRARDLHDNHALGMPFVYQTCEDIFPELKESEDEKIRKEIIQSIQDNMSVIHKDKCIAWLEKQGEKSICKVKVGETYKCIASPRYTCFRKGDIYHVEDNFVAELINTCSDCFVLLEKQDEQKPAWSEEDEDALDIAIRIIQNGGDDCSGILDSNKALNWLKSLKPNHWKPSKDQMFALSMHIQENPNLESLYNDLKKL